MSASERVLSPSEAAKRLGLSTKALRVYEQRGLIKPMRTAAGWRAYGPSEMARAGEIATLRALGLSLAQVACVLRGDPESLEAALAAHQGGIENRIRQLAETAEKVRGLRAELAQGKTPNLRELGRLVRSPGAVRLALDLPWPWGGERFELRDIRALNYIIGPLGSGKTRLALAISEHLPDAMFIGLERLADAGAAAQARLAEDSALKSRVDRISTWLLGDGPEVSTALVTLIVALECKGPANRVVDMVEQGLDHATQEALMTYLRHRGPDAPTLFLLTRSSAILDLNVMGPAETIILCPANHSPPTQVAPYPGAPGYEAVATCLASPEVRARIQDVVAMRC